MVGDPDSGKYRRTRLPSGRVRACGPSCMKRHSLAWRFAAGLVLANLREGVLSPGFYDPGREPVGSRRSGTLRRDGSAVQSGDPDRKGELESGVNHAKFDSLEGAQTYLDHWAERWADKRIHVRSKRQVATLFAGEME
jgi:hypothetical protein